MGEAAWRSMRASHFVCTLSFRMAFFCFFFSYAAVDQTGQFVSAGQFFWPSIPLFDVVPGRPSSAPDLDSGQKCRVEMQCTYTLQAGRQAGSRQYACSLFVPSSVLVCSLNTNVSPCRKLAKSNARRPPRSLFRPVFLDLLDGSLSNFQQKQ